MKSVEKLGHRLAHFDRANPPFSFVLLLATVALSVRMPHLVLTPSLWAEDVPLFIEGWLRSGLSSILQPGPGYHLLLQRLIAAGLMIVPLRYAELMFHIASIAIIYGAFLVTWVSFPSKRLSSRVAACLAILYVPINPSPIYLSLANSQWILGGVTTLLLVTNYIPCSRFKRVWCAILFVLCLTGPFSVIALPVVFARMCFYRDINRERLFYASILVPTAVQLVTLARSSARLNVTASDSVSAWIHGVFHNTILQFIPNPYLLFLFVVFLGVLLRKLARNDDPELNFQAFALLFVGVSIAAVSFYQTRYRPESIGPLLADERYFFIPFLLLIFFILSTAKGVLQPVGIFFVAFACTANMRSIALGPEGRGPNYWRSQVEAARYMTAASVLTRPVWADEAFGHKMYTEFPRSPPVARSVDLDSVEFKGLTASHEADGGWMVSAAGVQVVGRDLSSGSWNQQNVSISTTADNVTLVSVLDKENAMFQLLPVTAAGRRLIFSFEARSAARLTIEPHVTDYVSGQSFTAVLEPEWQRFVFDIDVGPFTTQGGVYVVLNSPGLGSFEIRNVRAAQDTQPSGGRHMLLRVPGACRPYGNLALTYSASSAVQPGLHRLDVSGSKDHFDDWDTQHRWVSGKSRNVMFAVPNNGARWLRISVAPPVVLRDVMLRCY